MKRDPFILVIVAVVVAALLVFGIKMARRRASQPVASTATGQLAPNFTLKSLDGKTVKLSDYRGKAVLVNFWATWCEPCNVEMPWLVDLHKKYASQGFEILGVAMDDIGEKGIAKFAQEKHVDYPILIGDDPVGDAYGGIPFLPGNFYIDRSGKIVDKAFGLKGKAEMEQDIQKIIASGAGAQSVAAAGGQ